MAETVPQIASFQRVHRNHALVKHSVNVLELNYVYNYRLTADKIRRDLLQISACDKVSMMNHLSYSRYFIQEALQGCFLSPSYARRSMK